MTLKIHQPIISGNRKDSFWYNGLIAETEHYQMVARGEVCLRFDGEDETLSDDDAREYARDNDLIDSDVTEDNDWEHSNWFEVVNKESPELGEGHSCGDYNEALATLKRCEKGQSTKLYCIYTHIEAVSEEEAWKTVENCTKNVIDSHQGLFPLFSLMKLERQGE